MSEPVEIEGYAEVRASALIGVEGKPWTLVERVRPRFGIPIGERVTIETVVEAAFTQGRDPTAEAADLILASELGPLLESADCTYDPEPRYDQVSDYLSVERLHIDLNLKHVDLTIGRQALNWGSGLVFHPTDLYAEVVATEPWRERRGVNAVKAAIPIGDHQVTAIFAVDDDLSPLTAEEIAAPDLSGAVKATFRAGGTDLSAVGHLASDGDWFAGADLRGNLGVGWWVEGGWHGKAGAAEVVVGADYSFDVLSLLYVAAEYRYDGTGALPEDYDFASRSTGATNPFDCAFLPVPAEEVEPRTTLGQHYADASLRLSITEDFGVGGVAIVNLLDGTGYAVPDVFANVGANAAVHVGAQIPFGAGGEFRPSAEDLSYTAGAYSADLSGLVPDATLIGWVRYSF
ncbi:MAG: hypothetical protein Q8P41_03050 [Pseudomonadota bacterium]|nr:hypothetical protein [Pseudomonadota bacterium]